MYSMNRQQKCWLIISGVLILLGYGLYQWFSAEYLLLLDNWVTVLHYEHGFSESDLITIITSYASVVHPVLRVLSYLLAIIYVIWIIVIGNWLSHKIVPEMVN